MQDFERRNFDSSWPVPSSAEVPLAHFLQNPFLKLQLVSLLFTHDLLHDHLELSLLDLVQRGLVPRLRRVPLDLAVPRRQAPLGRLRYFIALVLELSIDLCHETQVVLALDFVLGHHLDCLANVDILLRVNLLIRMILHPAMRY